MDICILLICSHKFGQHSAMTATISSIQLMLSFFSKLAIVCKDFGIIKMPCSNYSPVSHKLSVINLALWSKDRLNTHFGINYMSEGPHLTIYQIKYWTILPLLSLLVQKMIFNITVWHKNYQVKEITLVLMTLHCTSEALVPPEKLTKLCGGTQLSSKGWGGRTSGILSLPVQQS